MRTKKVVFIESNTTGTGRLFLKSVKKLGFIPVMLAKDPNRYESFMQDGIEFVKMDTRNENAVFETCKSIAEEEGLAGIFSCSDYFIDISAIVAQKLGLHGPDPNAIKHCRDKAKQLSLLQNARVGIPMFYEASTVEHAVSAAESLGMPVIIKPVEGSGSVGVKLCKNIQDVTEHSSSLFLNEKNERGVPISRRIIVQEMADGPEYSVEMFNGQVIGITKKYLSQPPYFVETGHDFPAVLSESEKCEIKETAISAVKALNLLWGPVHIELRLSSKGTKIIEVNPRLAGGFIPELVRLSTGIDLIYDTMCIVTGQLADSYDTKEIYSGIRFILPPFEGVVTGMYEDDSLRKMNEVVDISIYKKLPLKIVFNYDFRDRIGHIICTGSNPETVRNAIDTAKGMIKPVYAGLPEFESEGSIKLY